MSRTAIDTLRELSAHIMVASDLTNQSWDGPLDAFNAALADVEALLQAAEHEVMVFGSHRLPSLAAAVRNVKRET